jgi:hypothetical protein
VVPGALSGAPWSTVDELTARERAILDLEGQRFAVPGAKERRIRELFGCSPAAYYQVLNALLDREAALAYAPTTAARLRRLRERHRSGRRPS